MLNIVKRFTYVLRYWGASVHAYNQPHPLPHIVAPRTITQITKQQKPIKGFTAEGFVGIFWALELNCFHGFSCEEFGDLDCCGFQHDRITCANCDHKVLACARLRIIADAPGRRVSAKSTAIKIKD